MTLRQANLAGEFFGLPPLLAGNLIAGAREED
jgi:hypothetical protein